MRKSGETKSDSPRIDSFSGSPNWTRPSSEAACERPMGAISIGIGRLNRLNMQVVLYLFT